MSSTPETPAAVPVKAPAAAPTLAPAKHPLLQASEALVAHHPIIITGILALTLWGVVGKVQVAWAAHEANVFNSKNATLAAQVQTNAALAALSASDAQKVDQLVAQFNASKAETDQEIATLRSQLKKQQATDATLPPDQLAARWESLIKINDQVHPIPAGGYTITQAGAVATTQALENLSELETEIKDGQQTIGQEEGLQAGLQQEITDQKNQITGLNKQIGDDVAACTAEVNKQVAAVKADEHKSKRNWFLTALTLGFAGGIYLAK